MREIVKRIKACTSGRQQHHLACLGVRCRAAHRIGKIILPENRQIEIPLAALVQGRSNLVGRRSRQHNAECALAQHLCQGRKRNMLVVSSADHPRASRWNARKRGCGARGSRVDRAVIELNAILFAHEFKSVLHAAKTARKLPDHLGRDQRLCQRNRGHVILHVVHTGQLDVGNGQHFSFALTVRANDHTVADKDGLARSALHNALKVVQLGRKQHDGYGGCIHKLHAKRVVAVCDQRFCADPRINVALGRDIFVHAGMPVQVIGAEIGNRAARGCALHGHELKAGKLDNGKIILGHLGRVRHERRADVAAHVGVAVTARL